MNNLIGLPGIQAEYPESSMGWLEHEHCPALRKVPGVMAVTAGSFGHRGQEPTILARTYFKSEEARTAYFASDLAGTIRADALAHGLIVESAGTFGAETALPDYLASGDEAEADTETSRSSENMAAVLSKHEPTDLSELRRQALDEGDFVSGLGGGGSSLG